jgi:hypothetical protein
MVAMPILPPSAFGTFPRCAGEGKAKGAPARGTRDTVLVTLRQGFE